MTLFRLCAAALAIILIASIQPEPGALHAQTVDAAAVKKALAEIIKPETDDKRRTELGFVLLDAKPADLANALKVHLRRDAERAMALDIAINYQARGLFNTVEKHLETETERVAALAFATWDKGAAESIIKKWKESAAESSVYTTLLGLMTTRCMEPSALDDIRKIVVDKESAEHLKQDGTRILRVQTGFDGESATEVEFKYAGYMKGITNEFKRQPVAGMDLTLREGWNGKVNAFRGLNFKLEAGETIFNDHRPPYMAKGKYRVHVWFYSDSAEPQAFAGLRMKGPDGSGSWNGIELMKDKWNVKMSDGSELEAPHVAKTWHKLTFSGEYKSAEKKFITNVYVNDKPVLEGGVVDGMPVGVQIGCRTGSAIFSSIDCGRP